MKICFKFENTLKQYPSFPLSNEMLKMFDFHMHKP